MTARKPLESMDAPSDESLETTSSRGEGSSSDDGAGVHSDLERGEASISRTLEAILSKTDDDEVPLTGDATGRPSGGTGKGLGSHTLLGLGGYGSAKLPGVTPVEVVDDAAGPSISVDTMFDDPEDLLRGKAMAPPVGPADLEGRVEIEREEAAGEKVGDLLDEVAQALNVQAAETRDRAIGRIPSPGANAPGARGSMKTPLVRTAEEFEFEDPDDGPTTLNAGDGKLEAAAGQRAQADEDGEEDDEESVVLGPGVRSEGKREARLTGSHPGASLAGTGGRTTLPIPAVPMPGSAAAGSSRPTRATPFAGLPAATLPTFPAPGSGRTRLPTPAPGTAALGVAAATGAGRSSPPQGAPQGATLTARDESPGAMLVDAPVGRRSAGRISAPSGTLAAAESSGRSGAVEEPHPSALSSARVILEQALLRKELKFRPISIGAIALGVFVGGLFIGHSLIKGSPEATSSASSAAPASGTAPAVAASRPADPAVIAPVAPAVPPNPATKPATAAVVNEVPKNTVAAPAANPNGAVIDSPPVGTAQMQFDEQPTRKRRPHRAVTVSTDDLDIPSASKRVASVAPPPVSKTPTAGKSGPKKKSTWHDPFAD